MFLISKRFLFLILTLLLAVALLLTAVPDRAVVHSLPAQQSAGDPRFGAIESFWAPSEAAELGVGWERILFYWNEIQPNGPGDWNTLHVREEWLNEANAQGRQVVGLLKNTPNWATDGQFASGVPRGLDLPVDDPGNLWANYVRQVAGYYGPRGVHNWIIWNEPDIAPNTYGHEFSGTTEQYYQLLKVAYQVMKQVDPQAKIHVGGMTHWHDPGYLRKFLQVVVADPEAAANNYFFDIITYHIYFRPETIPGIVGNGFAVQSELGISPLKEVWINETNARPSMDPEWPVEVQQFHLDLEQQAWFIPQAFAHGFYAGANHIAVYKLIDINMNPGDESWGLLRPYDFSKRPAYYAYQNTIKHLSGFQYPIRREQSGNHFQFSFNRPGGVTRILWARNQANVNLQVPALAESGFLVDPVTGQEFPIMAVGGFYDIELLGARCHVECLLGGPPVFLVEAGVTTDALPNSPPPAVVAATTTPAPEVTAADPVSVTATIAPTEPVSATESVSSPTPVAPTATLVLTPTETATATAAPSVTPSVTPTAAPTETASPVPSATATAVPPTEVPATEVAALPPTTTAALPEAPETEAAGVGEQASWLFIGAGLTLGLLLIGVVLVRRRGTT